MRKAIKIEKIFGTKLAIAAFCTIASVAGAQQIAPAPSSTQPDHSYYGQKDQQNQVQRVQPQASSDQPQRLNKCSDLIGTSVENPQGDKLGKIEDVVLDLNSGRVSYAVLSVEHKVFSTPKYIALPLATLKPSSDGMRLILNADKNRIASAQGFDRNNWPSVNTAAWGAQAQFQTPSTDNMNNGTNYNSNYRRDVPTKDLRGTTVPGNAVITNANFSADTNSTKYPNNGNR